MTSTTTTIATAGLWNRSMDACVGDIGLAWQTESKDGTGHWRRPGTGDAGSSCFVLLDASVEMRYCAFNNFHLLVVVLLLSEANLY